MKKVILLTLALIIMSSMLSSCSKVNSNVSSKIQSNDDVPLAQSSYSRLNDVSAQKLKMKELDVSGTVSGMYKIKSGYWIFSRSDNTEKSFITLTDLNCNKIWEQTIESFSNGIVYSSDDFIVVNLFKVGYIALDKNGKEIWTSNFKDNFEADVFVADNAGGLLVFGRDNNTDDHKCIYYHISVSGLISNPQEFKNILNCYPLKGFNDSDGFWMYGDSGNIGFLAHMKSDLTVDKICNLRKDHYPEIFFDKEENHIILYGQNYQSGTEKGFIQEFDLNLNEKFYKTFDVVPSDIIRLKDSNRVISFYDRANAMKDRISIFDSNWSEKANINIQYAFTKLYAVDNGNFIVTGSRLSPGQGYGTLFINSKQPHMDTIVEEFDNNYKMTSRKTFFSENSKSIWLFYFYQ